MFPEKNILLIMSSLVTISTVTGESSYVRCIPGDLNVVLASPHGGNKKPNNIPDRTAGCLVDGKCVYRHGCGTPAPEQCYATIEKDWKTQEMTAAVANNLRKLTGHSPTVVYNDFHRTKLDPNRAVDEATLGVPEAIAAYEKYHGCISDAKKKMACPDGNGRGLVFDMHGQSHPINWTEIGYTIPKDVLNSGMIDPRESSIRGLYERSANTDFIDLLSGPTSLGNLLQKRDAPSCPSPEYPTPGDNPFFIGGYTTITHGSEAGGSVDAAQIEIGVVWRVGSVERSKEYASGLAGAIVEFMEIHNYTMNPSDHGNTTHDGLSAMNLILVTILSSFILAN